ncbi:type IV toxin-antitoxin system AbiEi family antitoxin domain-containing protein [Kribbella sp. NBC_01484]|uniref:type IV toxin-antitoxin system AbiEi family antitoxin domain-containing protein n=1 Tax=Kribbella sp. NBC_01484 TaxID=2903579 RepID=UPI003FA5745E
MNPELKRIAAGQGGVVSTRQAVDAGYTREQIRERLADGRWVRIRYGQYAERADLVAMESWDRQVFRHRETRARRNELDAAGNGGRQSSLRPGHARRTRLERRSRRGSVDADQRSQRSHGRSTAPSRGARSPGSDRDRRHGGDVGRSCTGRDRRPGHVRGRRRECGCGVAPYGRQRRGPQAPSGGGRVLARRSGDPIGPGLRRSACRVGG